MASAQSLAVGLVAEFEDFRAFPYPDPASPLAKATRGQRWGFLPPRDILAKLRGDVAALSGAPWTIGYGQTGKHITPDTPQWSQSIARANLEAEVEERIDAVKDRSLVTLTDGQLAALASFLFNVGPGGVGRKDGLFELKSTPRRPSTLWRKVQAGDFKGAAGQFGAWTKAQGQEMAGLVRRRAAERAMFERAA
jgi:lysozyme